MEFVTYKKQKIAYYSNEVEGTAVVLIHGYTEDSTMWDEFVEPFEEDYHVVKVDLQGHGQSEIKDNGSIADMAAAVMKVVSKLKIKKFVLIGHSMGGYVSLEIAKNHSKNLLGLGLFHSHPFADSEATKKARMKAVEFIDTNGHELYCKQLIPRLFKVGYPNDNRFLIETLVFRASRFPAKGLKNGQIAMADREDRTEVLKNMPCPVLMIIGKLDTTLAYDEMVQQAAMPATGVVHIMEKTGHMGMFTATKKTQEMVVDFLEFCES